MTTRRSALETLAMLAGGALVTPSVAPLIRAVASAQQHSGEPADEKTLQTLMNKAVAGTWEKKPMGELVSAVGLTFLGTPYLAHSLEAPGPERLIVNLQAFDCTTFFENTLVLSRCIKLGLHAFYQFKQQLQFVRYRSGVLYGYASRLHYFTDWVVDNGRRNVLRDVTRELGGIRKDRKINFMSTHVASYRQLSDSATLAKIKEIERQMSAREQYYVPKEIVGDNLRFLLPGDIIGITTSVEGLDVSHTGIAVVEEGIVKFLHAPLSGGSVEVTKGSLADYLAAHDQQTGIVVARPLDPAS